MATDLSPRDTLKQSVRDMPPDPGVYRMLDDAGDTLYVGKAKNLKKRVSSYFSRSLNTKNISLINRTADITVTVTASEAEALLLESNLIKTHRPRYNILLRDDKSYPYIRLDEDAFPRLSFCRTRRRRAGRYFGPYTNVKSVRETMDLIFKVFRLRQCTPSMFKNRRRPCLQYQIKRCCAPCVGYVTENEYADRVVMAGDVLSGKCEVVVERLIDRMNRASKQLEYERAAAYRDQIGKLRDLLGKQYVVSAHKSDIDVIACRLSGRAACVQVVKIRNGLNIGNQAFFPVLPKTADGPDEAGIVESFIGQYYLENAVPGEVVVNAKLDDRQVVEAMLSGKAGRKVAVSDAVRGHRRKWLESAGQNAADALNRKLLSRQNLRDQFIALRELLKLPAAPRRLECFDVSHTMGEETVASCVVFNEDGPDKRNYRRFNITGVTGGDDYAAMAHALTRRFQRLAKEKESFPDVLFIDGGKGQVSVARKALREFDTGDMRLVGVAKGPERRAGEETLIIVDGDAMVEMKIGDVSALHLMHLIQRVRDEAHRFAIAGHRLRRAKKRKESVLESIPGLGPKRRHSLLRYFGGLRGVGHASVDELAGVKGVSRNLAKSVYETMREYGGNA